MKESILTKSQKKVFTGGKGLTYVKATVRYDDQCGNGHNTFSITGEVYGVNGSRSDGCVTFNGRTLGMESCGCCHEDIAKYIPELAPYIKWHLCGSDMPMHYGANAIYFAGDRDCWGLRKGEKRQIRRGGKEPAWILEADKQLEKYAHGEECPAETATLRYVPWMHEGEGKEREFDNARSSAIWPDATDEELSVEPEELKKVLKARLPKLMEEFCQAVESLGFVY